MDKNEEKINLRYTPPFKIEDKDGKRGVRFDLKKQFGFMPKEVIVLKPKGMGMKWVQFAAVIPDEIQNEIEKRQNDKISSIAKKLSVVKGKRKVNK